MNKTAVVIISGSLFGIAGFALGFFLSKHKYIKMADQEIESIKSKQKEHDEWLLDFYGVKKEKKEKKTVDTKKSDNKTAITTDKVPDKKEKYNDYSGQYRSEQPTIVTSINTNSNVISSDEFYSSNFPAETLYYYKDGVVTDSDNNRLINYTKLIGSTDIWLSHLKKNVEDNVVYVRNTNTQIDYEILFCDELWSDIATPTQKSGALLDTDDDSDDDL